MDEMTYYNLNIEEKLLILLTRLTFSENEIEETREILNSQRINWFQFYKLALYHKVITLCWRNIKRICPNVFIPKYINDISNYVYISTAQRNYCQEAENKKLLKEFEKENIKSIPVKGSYLIPNMYKDYGIRYSGDSDFLIQYVDIKRIEKILLELGYIKGKYNASEKEIKIVSRKDDVMWKTFMSNMHPFVKMSNNELFPVYKLDFGFALDDSRSIEPITEIIDSYKEKNKVNPAHYLIHLCTHFYDEAKHSVDIFLAKDFNLIKLCDIREFIIQFTTEEDLEELIKFAKKYLLEKQVYYAMFFLGLIYGDGYETNIMDSLNVKDISFLNTFGDNTLNARQVYRKKLFERIFTCGNMDELITVPKMFL